MRKWRECLPLQRIRSHDISISTKHTPSTLAFVKTAFTFSLHEIIWRVLNNPSIISQMYFGPCISVHEKSEIWYGDIWKTSPLFGQESLNIGGGLRKFTIKKQAFKSSH